MLRIWNAIPLWLGFLLAPLFFLLGTLLRSMPLPWAVLVGLGVWAGTVALFVVLTRPRVTESSIGAKTWRRPSSG